MQKVILRVDRGLVNVVSKPKDIEVIVHDYDCDGMEEELLDELLEDEPGTKVYIYNPTV